MPLLEQYALQEVGDRLSQLVGNDKDDRACSLPHEERGLDAFFGVGGYRFAVEYKTASGAAALSSAANQVKTYARRLGGNVIPLIAVPYMGESGQRMCEELGVAWLDLSGNARIKAPRLHVWIEGHPNMFKAQGRPSNVFAPKSARIARWFLSHPGAAISQRELAHEIRMDEGQMSRVMAQLRKEDLVVRDQDGLLKVRDRLLLLDAWHEAYEFSKHQLIKGHIVARSGEEIMAQLAQTLETHQLSYAMTGLGAAWQLSHFAGFKLNTVYLENRPKQELLDALGFRQAERGANTWLILPVDEGVFQGAERRDGIRCVHPVQVYMDLKGLPERANEAAHYLRNAILKGEFDAG